MLGVVTPLTLELLAWIDSRPRAYADAIEAWRTNCPRHPVWEDALDDGLIEIVRGEVALTPVGRAELDEHAGVGKG